MIVLFSAQFLGGVILLPVSSLIVLGFKSNWNADICSISMELILADAHWIVLFRYAFREGDIASIEEK